MTIRFAPLTLCNFALLLLACGGSSAEAGGSTTPESDRPAAVAPIPEGYHSLTPSLVVTDVRAAVAFYGNALGAVPIFAIDGPDGAPVHAEIRIDDSIVIYAAASLEADGGNNDAAALFHVATVAKASLRKAKLLVMISDGLPTECSVNALRALVQKLTRREKMCCAQVAVRPLEEVCFPHYVLLEEAEIDPAVRRFGTIVTGLVRRALSA
jgi:hypothetical protein